MGASGWTLYREVIVPAALPGFIAGLQQAWGFAWKALMAAELIITAVGATGLGPSLGQEQRDVPALLAVLGVIVAIGVAVDYLVFNRLERRVRPTRGCWSRADVASVGPDDMARSAWRLFPWRVKPCSHTATNRR